MAQPERFAGGAWNTESARRVRAPEAGATTERRWREVAGETAAVRLRESYLGMTFLDTFGMLRVDGLWTIYNKLFHCEP